MTIVELVPIFVSGQPVRRIPRHGLDGNGDIDLFGGEECPAFEAAVAIRADDVAQELGRQTEERSGLADWPEKSSDGLLCMHSGLRWSPTEPTEASLV